MSIADRCREARKAKKISQQELADAITRLGFKIGQSTIGNLEAGKVQAPRFLHELAQALGVTTEWLRSGKEYGTAQPDNIVSSMPFAPVVIPHLESMPRDLPVLGKAQGGNGMVVMSGDAIDYVRRPPSLVGRTDVFALFVEEMSMAPAFTPGDLIFVERRRPRVGDHAVIEFRESPKEEVRVIIKRLAAVTGSSLRLEQYNPHKILEIKAASVIRIQRVMTMADLFVV